LIKMPFRVGWDGSRNEREGSGPCSTAPSRRTLALRSGAVAASGDARRAGRGRFDRRRDGPLVVGGGPLQTSTGRRSGARDGSERRVARTPHANPDPGIPWRSPVRGRPLASTIVTVATGAANDSHHRSADGRRSRRCGRDRTPARRAHRKRHDPGSRPRGNPGLPGRRQRVRYRTLRRPVPKLPRRMTESCPRRRKWTRAGRWGLAPPGPRWVPSAMEPMRPLRERRSPDSHQPRPRCRAHPLPDECPPRLPTGPSPTGAHPLRDEPQGRSPRPGPERDPGYRRRPGQICRGQLGSR
jgi:hypothetical protein